jgi:hypothetical protein
MLFSRSWYFAKRLDFDGEKLLFKQIPTIIVTPVEALRGILSGETNLK